MSVAWAKIVEYIVRSRQNSNMFITHYLQDYFLHIHKWIELAFAEMKGLDTFYKENSSFSKVLIFEENNMLPKIYNGIKF